MSLKDKKEITDRIWQHSQARSLGKMLLLALVESADVDGFCYPSQETLGKMIGLKGEQKTIQRNTFHHLAPLIKSGELITWEQQGRKGGRGYTNIYLIAVGLTDEQIRERVQRRFKLFDDELDAALSQTGEIYTRLCTDRRIAADKLDLTNPEAQKPPKFDATEEEKPPKNDVLNPDKAVKSSPQLSQDSKKVVKFGGGTNSLNPKAINKQTNDNEDIDILLSYFLTASKLKPPSSSVIKQKWEDDLNDIYTAADSSLTLAQEVITYGVAKLDEIGYSLKGPGSITKTCQTEAARRLREVVESPPLPTPLDPDPPSIPTPNEAIWKQAQGILKTQMTGATFDTVIKGTQLTRKNGHYVIIAPTEASRQWLEGQLAANVRRAVSTVTGSPAEVEFKLDSG